MVALPVADCAPVGGFVDPVRGDHGVFGHGVEFAWEADDLARIEVLGAEVGARTRLVQPGMVRATVRGAVTRACNGWDVRGPANGEAIRTGTGRAAVVADFYDRSVTLRFHVALRSASGHWMVGRAGDRGFRVGCRRMYFGP